jgi:catecholate siderophore receptor
MTSIKKPISLRSTTALACACTILSGAAIAKEDTKKDKTVLPSVVVEATEKADDTANPYANPEAPYKVEVLSSPKYSRPIAQTPKSITVIGKEAMEDSGATSLSDVMRMQPGVTIGTGEGGNAFGDRYIIRGFEARNDVFVDGLRDPGVTTRELFAVDQIEISKGPSSSFAGRGTTGGAVNNVTKKAKETNFTKLETSFGTDNKQRYTADNNLVVNNDLAIRTNLLYSDRDVPGREGVEQQRDGAAVAIGWQASDDLKVNADYYYQTSDDTPDGGVPWDALTGEPVPGKHYYGQNGRDYLKTAANIATLGLEYDINDNLKVSNQTRYGVTKNEYVVTIPGLASAAVPAGTPIGLSTPGVFARSSSQNRNQENTYYGNQTNFMLDTEIADMKHSWVFGTEFSKELATNLPFLDSLRSPNAGDPFNPNNNAWLAGGGTLTQDPSKYAELEINSQSLYVLDTWTINPTWELFGGLRYDTFDYSINSGATAYSGSTAGEIKDDEGFLNGHAGVVFSPWENGNIYASYSTSSNPTGEQIDSFTNCAYGGLCRNVATGEVPKPELNQNIELGTKWELMDKRLLLTGAVFQTIKENVISSIGTGATAGFTQFGELQVRGIEVGVAGNITEKLSAQAGVALLDTEITKSDTASEVGQDFPNTAETSANVQLRYQTTNKWALGTTVTYTGEISGGAPNAGTSGNTLDANIRLDLMTEYAVTKAAKVRLNILNVTDEVYYTALYRSASPFVYVGEGRSATVTLSYEF